MSANPNQENKPDSAQIQKEVEIAAATSDAETLTDQIHAMVDAAAGSVDEHSWTPGRFITVFFPEFYDGSFVKYHGNIILIILGFVLSIIASRDKFIELKALEQKRKSEGFIIASLRKKGESKSLQENQGLDEEQRDKVLKDLKQIADKLFPGRSLNIDNGNFKLAEIREEKIIVSDSLLPERVKEFLDNIENSKNLFYKFLRLIINFVKNTWKFLSAHSFYYWIIWFFVVFLISANFSIPLGLGLAAIVPGLYLILKIGFYIKNKPERNIEIGEDELLIIHVYLARLKMDKLNAELKEENLEDNIEEKKDDQPEVSKEETFKSIFKRKKRLIFTAFMSALVSGYVVAIFIQWPLTDFLISVLHVPGIAGSGAFAFSATAIPIFFGIALGIGLVLAIVEGIKKHDQIEKSKAKLNQFIKSNDSFLKSKHKFENKIQFIERKIAELDAKNRREDANKWKERIRKIPRDLWPEKNSRLEKFRRCFAMFITGGGSGIFVVRTLLFAATLGIIPLFFTLSWGLTLGIALGVGAIWGIFKIGAMIQAKEEARELEIIERLDYFKSGYENYTKLLHNIAKGILADLNSQQKTDLLSKRAESERGPLLSLQDYGTFSAPQPNKGHSKKK